MIVLGFLLKQQLFLMQVFGLECSQSVTLMAKHMNCTMGKDVLNNESFCLETIGYKKLASGFVKAFVNHLNH
ncbi:hypothetical protein ZEAMMB73_Zm00001d046465 [Zea mays]|uniref:Uncharacterized protein n=1 Tax=Zea mays TaxID=4577 RepID=A0A1D6P2V7_MAIZE|nr:hypothetical protein ZEAMMB73_Zm00001d046465 [Zea mays]